jgi:hypothetical protein
VATLRHQFMAGRASTPDGSGLAAQLAIARDHFARTFSEASDPEPSWNRTTIVALATLAVLWAVLMLSTWATWGNLTIDSGREIYVPSVLSEGKMLYRDIWYLYGPAAPYVNSFLFHLFGVRLSVLYVAGSLSALGSAIFLYLTGMRLSSWIVGWTAGAVVLLQAFQPSLFCFPLPYSFSSVYGCLTSCVFLWLIIGASSSTSWLWMFGAGTAAAAALLLKLEFGMACYTALFLLVAARAFRDRTWKRILGDSLAILPGVVLCVAVIRWMLSIAGVEFITQENLASWPTSFFMRTYGKYWLGATGLSLNGTAFVGAIFRTIILAAIVAAFVSVLQRTRSLPRSIFLRAAIVVAGLAILVKFLPWQAEIVFGWIFFPQDMVLYIGIAAVIAWWHFWRQPQNNRRLQVALLFSFSSMVAFRMLLGMHPGGYPIYYNGPVVLAFFWVLARFIFASRPASRQIILQQAEAFVCFACLAAVFVQASPFTERPSVPLTTERGTVRVSKQMAENYLAAIAFMREQAAKGESVLSVPEDTSLYFLSATDCPTRFFAISPGMLTPGKMTSELIQEIERKPTRYLIWSNRDFPQFHLPLFAADPARTVLDYLRAHYRPLRSLPDDGPGWTAVIWERIPEGEQK